MASLHPVELFSLAIPPDGEPVPALIGDGEQATFRITMAAIDPTAAPSLKGQTNGASAFTGAVLKIIRVPADDDSEADEDDEDEDSLNMADLLNGASGSSDEESEDEDTKGAPSDPAKSPKAKRMAALKEALADAQKDDDNMDVDGELSAKAKGKGKAKAAELEDEDDSDMDDSDMEGAEEFVLCSLDPEKSYQQPLDITVSEYETVYFRATGSHKIYLTGNVLYPVGQQDHDDYDSEEEGYDFPPGEEEEGYPSDEDESDELDDIDDPRITEVDSEDEQDQKPPKLVKVEKAEVAKGKNKRALQDSSDAEQPATEVKAELEAKAGGEEKMTKNQLKKLRKKQKNNEGNAVETTVTETKTDGPGDKKTTTKTAKEDPSNGDKSDKKVQFAKELVQGPSGSAQPNGDVAKEKTQIKTIDASKTNGDKDSKATGQKGIKTVQGVTIDDKKPGSGPGAKNGNRVSMRYIGKLEKDKSVFDSNKKGPPFRFTLGSGEVIKGWEIGMQGIQTGGERRITIPAHLAYGSKKTGSIPPNSSLVFDVKCIEIK